MQVDAVQVIKYICIVLLMIYTISSFEVLSVKQNKRLKLRFHFHNLIIFTFHFLANLSLIISRPSLSQAFPYITFYLAQVLFFIAYILFYRLVYKGCNLLLLNHTVLLLSIGLVTLMRLNPTKAQNQLLYAALAAAGSLFFPYIATKIKITKMLASVLGVIGLLCLVFVFVRGKTVYGATLSISVFGIAIQPSEFVKISFILLIAMLFRRNHSFSRVCFATAIAFMHVGVLMISKDLGNALIFFVTYLFMLYAATHTIKYSLLGLSLTAAVCVIIFGVYSYAVTLENAPAIFKVVVKLFSHVQTRINNWIDPWATINDDGYQIVQSLFAILSGGWFGTGLGKGFPTEIPVVVKDFTFSAICEEFGGLVALCLILICLNLLLSILLVAVRMKNTFYKLMAVGFASFYGVQVFLVVGGVTKMIPHTGVTLPLVSYGGSSVSSTIICFAFIQGLTVLWRQEERKEKELEKEADKQEGKPVVLPKKKNRNKEVFGVAYTHTAAYILVAVYFIALLAKPSDDILNNSYNRARLNAKASNILRGDIYSGDGELLATTAIINGEEHRIYPQSNITSHVVGYLSKGMSGLESLGNFWLKKTGDDFYQTFISEITGTKLSGYSLYSTIDLAAQKKAEELMQGKIGAVVCLDAKTGDVLVMVSKPDFDPVTLNPSNLSDIPTGLENSYLLNRCVSGLYPPGSSFKPLMLLAYLREHKDVLSLTYTCDGEYVLPDHIIHCDHGSVHGIVDYKDALCVSCNGYFANLAKNISIETFNNTMADLLFQKRLTAKSVQGVTSVPALNTAQSVATMKDTMTDTQRAIMGMGQGAVSISPIHSALITAAIANGGTMPAPRYLDHIENAKGYIVETFDTATLSQVMTADEAAILKEAMSLTLTKGTGYLAATDNYLAGGKTGSAQFVTGSDRTHAIYTGFGELDGRVLSIAVFIEDGGSGGQVAAPIAKQVLDELFDSN